MFNIFGIIQKFKIKKISTIFMQKFLLSIFLILSTCSMGSINYIYADAVEELVVTVGADLNPMQRQMILQRFGISLVGHDQITEMSTGKKGRLIVVTNAEEHSTLGQSFDARTIGNQALSSAKISMHDTVAGISINTNNISNVTKEMYAGVLTTAGIKNADINVDAPFRVSGTGALTGIIKAFEIATGKKIDPKNKKIAADELALTSQIMQTTNDPNKTAQFMLALKKEISDNPPKTPAEYTQIINNISQELKINISPEITQNISNFAENFKSLNIPWSELLPQFQGMSEELKKVFNLEHIKNITGIEFDDNFFTKITNLLGQLLAFALKIIEVVLEFIRGIFVNIAK